MTILLLEKGKARVTGPFTVEAVPCTTKFSRTIWRVKTAVWIYPSPVPVGPCDRANGGMNR